MGDTNAKADAKAAKARAKAERPWYKRKRWIGLLVIAAIILIAVLAGGGDDGGEPASDTAEDTEDGGEEPAETASIGESASDGQFTFTVTEPLDCGQTTIGEEPTTEEAQGQWCLLTATVENTGDEARGLSASAQLLYDTQDREFEASMPMAVAGDLPIYEQINPGNSVEGRFFFDVPTDFEPSHVELHDSPMSSGVRVDLGGS